MNDKKLTHSFYNMYIMTLFNDWEVDAFLLGTFFCFLHVFSGS